MKITNIYTQEIPATRFIGLAYGDQDRVGGSFGAKWGEAFATGLFGRIEAVAGTQPFFEDSPSYIGLMRAKDGEPFTYWIGMFTPAGTPVPEGLGALDFPAATLGVGWVCGNEQTGDIYGKEQEVWNALAQRCHQVALDDQGAVWCLERYQCPRFTTPDENGQVTLDIAFYLTPVSVTSVT